MCVCVCVCVSVFMCFYTSPTDRDPFFMTTLYHDAHTVCVGVCRTGVAWRCGVCVCVCVTWRCGLWFTRVLMTRARGRWGREKESKQRDALRRDDENYIIKQTERCGMRNKRQRERERERERERDT